LRRQDDDRQESGRASGREVFRSGPRDRVLLRDEYRATPEKVPHHPLLSPGSVEGPGSSPESSGQPGQRDSLAAEWTDGRYLEVLKKSSGITVALNDKPENILERITFYDIDSKLIEKELTAHEKRLHLREIKKDITYFGKTYERADLQVDISGLDIEQAAGKVKEALEVIDTAVTEHGKSEQVNASRREIAGALLRR
jgi:hypothetical protein